MKRVLIFSLGYYPDVVGGAEVAIKEITDRITPTDYEFHVLTLAYDSTLPKEEKIGNTYIHRFGLTTKHPTIADLKKFPLNLNKPLFQFWAFWQARKLHKKYKFDAIWAMMAHASGVPAGLFKRLYPNIPYVLTLQEGDPPPYIEAKMRPIYPLFKAGFTKADRIQAISHFLAHWAKKMSALSPISVIPNGVDIQHFSQGFTNEDIEIIKTKLQKKEGDIFLVTTSRLVKKNACDDVICALQYLPENVHFIILGIGPDEVLLRKLAQDLHLEKRVQFLGQINREEMPQYLQACDIFIRPSLSEGMGISFVEAMAAKLPVIATQVGGISDFLFDPVLNPDQKATGRAVLPHDPRGISDAVNLFLNDKNKTKEIIENAYVLVSENYSWDLVARRMKEEVFDALF